MCCPGALGWSLFFPVTVYCWSQFYHNSVNLDLYLSQLCFHLKSTICTYTQWVYFVFKIHPEGIQGLYPNKVGRQRKVGVACLAAWLYLRPCFCSVFSEVVCPLRPSPRLEESDAGSSLLPIKTMMKRNPQSRVRFFCMRSASFQTKKSSKKSGQEKSPNTSKTCFAASPKNHRQRHLHAICRLEREIKKSVDKGNSPDCARAVRIRRLWLKQSVDENSGIP